MMLWKRSFLSQLTLRLPDNITRLDVDWPTPENGGLVQTTVFAGGVFQYFEVAQPFAESTPELAGKQVADALNMLLLYGDGEQKPQKGEP